MTDPAGTALDRALADLGRHLRYPSVPDLARGVLARLEAERVPATPFPPRLRRLVMVAAATMALLVGGLAAISPAVRAALVRVLELPGVRIEVGDTAPPAEERPLGHGLDLGRRITLDQATLAADFSVGVPEALGDPDEVYLDPATGAVSLVWRERPGLPRASSTGAGALLTQFRATTDELLVKKLVEQEVPVSFTEVNGADAFWIGGPHPVTVLDERGIPVDSVPRLAGNTLLWSRDGVTYRLESDLGVGASVAIAESLE